jgi:AraC-like DNA-binding protein
MSVKVPLSQFPFLNTTDVDQARKALGQVYGDGRLIPVGSSKSFWHEFNVARLGKVTLTAMDWGCGMTFQAPSLDSCFDFSSIVHGVAEARVGHETLDCDVDRGVVMSPSKSLDIRWCDRLISMNAKVERGTLESHLAALAGIELRERLEFSPKMSVNGAGASVRRLIRHMCDEIHRDGTVLAHPLITERFSETLLSAILYAQPHNYRKSLVKAARSAGPKYVHLAEEYIEAHCDQEVTAQRLAQITGVSVSALYRGFREYRSYTPIELLKTVRLRKARDQLLAAAPGCSVTRVAAKWGFLNLGRFAADYRQQFGENPSDTLRRARV